MREYRIELFGGPLDGTTWEAATLAEAADGGYLVADGQDLRAHYEPLPGDLVTRWHFLGMVEV